MFSAVQRPKIIQSMADYQFDLLVIGGGITGAGIALDAVTRGLSVALVDMQDFTAGTSSRSTKLIHGGLRYLKQLEVKIVAETGRERDIVYHNALHVTEPERMLLPFYKGGTFGKYTTSVGLFAYDLLAGVRKEERRAMLTPDETLQMEPLLKRDGLLGGGHYVEYRTDDARLTIEVLKKAAEQSALCLNYAKAEQFIYKDGQVAGVTVRDQWNDRKFPVHAKVVVNAAGPWVDEVREKDGFSNDKRLCLSKGVHIVIDRLVFPLRQAIYFDAPDGRMIFAIPRGNKAYIGTTDTFYEGDPMNPLATEEDVHYLLDAVHHLFPETSIKRSDVESTWAGVRPLIYEGGKGAPSDISRKDEIWEAASGLITIAGGKLTGYRKMAETVVDLVVKRLHAKMAGPCVTEHLPLSGGDFRDAGHYQHFIESKANEALLYGLSKEDGRKLAAFYGTNVDTVFTYAHAFQKGETGLSVALQAEIFYAIHHEMALTPSDFFIRRQGDMYFHIDFVISIMKEATAFMGQLLSYSDDEEQRLLHELELHLTETELRGE
ncbi:glycerol-3-phosphate dehydrogenase/oxidase [Sporosarcina sp. 179-K 3D1 HS]|uniref:glycerol-3-phosphate dehydrogenase/oxidase n=1 Tax=Sporosarcina sp. 179-K 3D1 HS TaxID=3232169 RepID=UPI0039A06F81